MLPAAPISTSHGRILPGAKQSRASSRQLGQPLALSLLRAGALPHRPAGYSSLRTPLALGRRTSVSAKTSREGVFLDSPCPPGVCQRVVDSSSRADADAEADNRAPTLHSSRTPHHPTAAAAHRQPAPPLCPSSVCLAGAAALEPFCLLSTLPASQRRAHRIATARHAAVCQCE